MDDILNQILANPTVVAIGTALAGGAVALWLAAAWWAYTDAARRTDSALAATLVAGWIVLSTPLLLPLSLPIYALARPQQSAGERRTKRLAADLVNELEETAAGGTCLSCRAAVEPGWLRCPSCTTWLALPCASCDSWSDRGLAICPYCGAEERAEPATDAAFERITGNGRARRGPRRLKASGPTRAAALRSAPRRLVAPEGRPIAGARAR